MRVNISEIVWQTTAASCILSRILKKRKCVFFSYFIEKKQIATRTVIFAGFPTTVLSNHINPLPNNKLQQILDNSKLKKFAEDKTSMKMVESSRNG